MSASVATFMTKTANATATVTGMVPSSTASALPTVSVTNPDCDQNVMNGVLYHTAGLNGFACAVSFPPQVLNIGPCCANETTGATATASNNTGGADIRVDNDCTQYCVVPPGSSDDARNDQFRRCISTQIDEQVVGGNKTGFISYCHNYGPTSEGISVGQDIKIVSTMAVWTAALLGCSLLL